VLLRMARQYQLLETEALSELADAQAPTLALSVAVNADSLATWFRPVVAASADWHDVTLQLRLEDEDISSELLQAGQVVGAVTADPIAVAGCSIESLGQMRYLPVAAPRFVRAWRQAPGLPWASMPVIRFNAKDDMQQQVLDAHHVTETPPTSMIPSAEGYLAAVEAGLGWGLVPEAQLGEALTTRRLIRLNDHDKIDVPLYWQNWRIRSDRIERLTKTIKAEAARALRQKSSAPRSPGRPR
jgi:LysR family transcriptional regulator (chromosome initiation inhibitor)